MMSEDDFDALAKNLASAGVSNAGARAMRALKIVNYSDYPLEYHSDGAIGLDLPAKLLSPRYLIPGHRAQIDTGISVEIPPGLGALVLPRSGLALHHGVFAITGVIDRDYRGEIKVLLVNMGAESYKVSPGDRIAQLLITGVPRLEIIEVTELSATERGASGFGSSGR